MSNKKASWIVFGLLTLICSIIFKDYLSLKNSYYFYDISCDGIYLFYPFISNICDIIANFHIPQWSFKVGMGQNVFPFLFRDPFDIILYLAGKDNILPLTIYLEVFKIIFTGWIFFKYLKLLNLSDLIAVAGTLLYSFCGFVTEGSAAFIFTFESFNFALLLYAYELFLQRKRWFLLCFAVFLFCISMPFNLYVYGLFMTFYAIFRHLQSGKLEFKTLSRLFIQLLGIMVVGILLSGPFLLQNIWLLLHNPRGADSNLITNQMASLSPFHFSDGLQLGTCIMRFFSNDILGSGDNFKGWGNHILEAPLFYCGLPCLLLLPQIFPFLNKRVKIIFISAIVIWMLPIFFPYFRYAFWLFTGNYYRAYSFFVAFMFIFYSIHALEHIFKQQKINISVLVITLAALLLLLYFPVSIDKHNIDKPIQLFTAIMLVCYSIVLLLISQLKNSGYLKYVFFIILFTELCYTGWITVNRHAALSLSWMQENKVLFNDYSSDAVKLIQNQDKTFYRIDKYLEPNTSRYSGLNYAQRQGYNSTGSYNPFNQLYYIRYLQLMGVVDKTKEKESRWAIGLMNNPLLESQNNVKYYLGQNNMHPAWPEIWDSVARIGDVTVFKNKYALPFGYTYNKYIKEDNFNKASPLQREFITMRAFVVNDKDIDKVGTLKEFSLSDTGTDVLDVNAFTSDIGSLKKDTLSIEQFDDNNFNGYVDLSEDKLLYFQIPYDDGWQLIVDVTELRPIVANGGMMGIFLEKGRHHIQLFYKLRFIRKGLLMTLIGLILLIGINWTYLKKKGQDTKRKFSRKILSNRNYLYIAPILVAIPILLYIYFLKCKTNVIYGDDLSIFEYHLHLKNLFEKINMSLAAEKYRPVSGLVQHLVIVFFQKNLTGYYVFNILVQTINTLIFARILNLFLKSIYFSIFFSLILGLSRFAVFNISQLYNGGALEGIAMTFFLLSLFFLLKALVNKEASDLEKQKEMLKSILYANLSMYCHERYLVLFAFLLLLLLFFPGLKTLALKRKFLLISGVIGSIIINVFIKTFLLGLPFFVGTGGTSITLSFPAMLSFFNDALLSIVQLNSGADYLTGITFTALAESDKLFVITIVCFLTTIMFLYIKKTFKMFILKLFIVLRAENSKLRKKFISTHYINENIFHIFVSLFVLFILFLAPAVSTIRLEQRFLQTSFSVFILMIVIGFNSLSFKNNIIKKIIFSLFIICFVWTDYNYFYKGIDKFYFVAAENTAKLFEHGIRNEATRKNLNKLYIWEKQKDVNIENVVNWSTGGGAIYDFYQGNNVKIIFVDSLYKRSDTGLVNSFSGFNKNTDQIIYINEKIVDITGEYLNDSLKTFIKTGILNAY